MGYDLHITRAEDWADDAGSPITAAEWHALVAADPELTLDPRNGPHCALWSGPDPDGELWLDWFEPGQIYTKHPDRALVAKMLRLADHFNARVQGDDGEIYTDPDDWMAGPIVPPRRSWWRRLLG